MTEPFLDRIASGKLLLADGAMGTELQKLGLEAGAAPELLNVTNTSLVTTVHRAYAAAGSELLTTNTFGANRFRLALHGLEARVAELCAAAVAAARAAAAQCYIAGNIGPTGVLIEPLGDVRQNDVYAAFYEQAAALAEAGTQLILIETMMDPLETVLAVRASKAATGLPVAACMTFENGNAGMRTMWGTAPAQAVTELLAAGADVIGANCGKGFDEIVLLAAEFRQLTAAPLIFQSNAGLPVHIGGKSQYTQGPDSMARFIPQLLAAAPAIIGGCCGTTPAHIAAIKQLL